MPLCIMMKQKKKSNRQWRREIIADVKRREAEKRKEKWRIRRCWAALCGGCISFSLLLLSIILSNVPDTFSNLILGLMAINGGFCLSAYIISKAAWNLVPKIPLNDGSLRNRPLPASLESPAGIKYEDFSRIDDKQLVMDNDSVWLRIFLFSLFLMMFLYLALSKLSTEAYAGALLSLEMEVFAISGMINNMLKPWRRIVFDRISKTVTIPPRFPFQKKQTIPYGQAVLTLRYYPKGTGGDIVITNPRRPLGGVPLGTADDGTETARRFARFIQIYMEEEEWPDRPEFGKCRNREKQEQAGMEKEVPIWKR